MKVSLSFLALSVLLVQRISCAAIEPQSPELISLEDVEADLSKLDRADLEYLAEVARTKRSGDLLSAIKHKIASGIQTKLGLIGHGSASASGHFSGGSSGGGYGHDHGHGQSYEYDHHHDHSQSSSYEHNHVDFWSLKKSILSTLLQAAKAIKGGVIAIKGQLIKGGGHLLSAKGKLISSKGEAITQLGRHIASTAKLYPTYSHSVQHHAPVAPAHVYGHSGPANYGHSSEYSSSAGVEDYGAIPAGHGEEYSVPAASPYNSYKYNAAIEAHKGYHKIPNIAHAGIVIMKKIPTVTGHIHHGIGSAPSSPGYSFGDVHDSHPPTDYAPTYPDFKPLGPSSSSSHYQSHKPSYSSLFKGVFSASASPQYKHPAPSTHSHTYPGNPQPYGEASLPMEIDYDPRHPSGPNFGGHSPPTHSVSDSGSSYGAPSYNTPIAPPSTNYGHPVEPLKHDLPQNVAELQPQHAPSPQIHITPTTNFIEYTNIQNTDSQQHLPPQALHQLQYHQNTPHGIEAAPHITSSHQMAEEVIKYLGKLQHQGAATSNNIQSHNTNTNNNNANNNNANPHLFFGVNVPLGGNDGGEVQDESFPLYPPGTSPQNNQDHTPFIPTPLPPESSGAFPPSGAEFSGELPAPLYPSNHSPGYQVDSYGKPLQFSKSYPNNHNFETVQFLKPHSHQTFTKSSNSHSNHHNHHNHHHHHPNGVVSSQRQKSKPEFDIVRSVSFELGAAGGPIIHH